MLLRQDSQIDSVKGAEGTAIKQYFDPSNTSDGISYSLSQFTLKPKKRSKLHIMKSSEVYYILEGCGNLRVDNVVQHVKKDDAVHVPANSRQSIENSGSVDLRFLCIVEPAWKASDEIVLEKDR